MASLQDQSQRILDLGNGTSFGIWCIRFSEDGTKLVAGTTAHTIEFYDIPTSTSLYRIPGHIDDVNSVGFAEMDASNVLLSGSDDGTIKIWDTRSISYHRPAGVLVGHTEGITYVSPKGDSRYILSNAKDQTMKLWDLRHCVSSIEFDRDLAHLDYFLNWDYRWMPYPSSKAVQHPRDHSVKTFSGHQVLRTLIRCYFSPLHTTGQRYKD